MVQVCLFVNTRCLILSPFVLWGVGWLGGYDVEEKAARAYDLAALKYWGASTHVNFPVMS
jgi:hypothetical protein